jgi:hypothetical protein
MTDIKRETLLQWINILKGRVFGVKKTDSKLNKSNKED